MVLRSPEARTFDLQYIRTACEEHEDCAKRHDQALQSSPSTGSIRGGQRDY